jgi:hypothetical protein
VAVHMHANEAEALSPNWFASLWQLVSLWLLRIGSVYSANKRVIFRLMRTQYWWREAEMSPSSSLRTPIYRKRDGGSTSLPIERRSEREMCQGRLDSVQRTNEALSAMPCCGLAGVRHGGTERQLHSQLGFTEYSNSMSLSLWPTCHLGGLKYSRSGDEDPMLWELAPTPEQQSCRPTTTTSSTKR